MFEDELIYDYIDLINMEDLEEPPQYPLSIEIKDAMGCYLIDKDNNKYLDLTSCCENHPLGYTNLQGSSGFYDSELVYSCDSQNLANMFKELTGLEKAYFTSSKTDCYKIVNQIIQENLDDKCKILITSSPENRKNYILPNIKTEYVPVNRDTIIKTVFTKETGAIIVELVQISDTIDIATTDYLRYLRELCDRNHAILVFDVSSIAPFRLTNHFLNYDISIKPDILILSKGLSHGIPFGAVLTRDKLEFTDKNNDYGSSTIAYKQVSKLLEDYNKQDFATVVRSNAKYFEKSLNELAQTHISVVDICSYGMLYTMLLEISAYDIAKQCLNQGIIVETINNRTIKLSPPYTIGKEEIDKLVNVLDGLFDKLAKYDRLR